MSQSIVIPPVGESVTSAMVGQWHKEDGASVLKGETLVSLETDKVSHDLEATGDGILKIQVQEGEEVEIGAVIGSIEASSTGAPSESVTAAESEPESGSATPDSVGSEGRTVQIKVPAAGESITSATVGTWAVGNGDRVTKGQNIVSLDTDKVSQDLEAEVSGVITIDVQEGQEVEIGRVLGSIIEGSTGVPVASETPANPTQLGTQAPAPASQPSVKKEAAEPVNQSSPAPSAAVAPVGEDEARVTRRKMTPIRRKIAEHLVNAQQTAAILTTFNEVDMSAVMKLRKEVQDDFVKKHGCKLGFMSLFTKAVVQALKDVPSVNGRIEGSDIIENHFYDIGIAIGTEKGLMVPVVRDCDSKSFADIEKSIIDYAGKAKENKIDFSDLQGGVFTISNGGTYGSLLSTPILNPPQSGILGMHTIQQRPVAIDGKVEIRPMMYLALSYDHRIVDGKEAVTFLIRIKDCLENPTRMMLEM